MPFRSSCICYSLDEVKVSKYYLVWKSQEFYASLDNSIAYNLIAFYSTLVNTIYN